MTFVGKFVGSAALGLVGLAVAASAALATTINIDISKVSQKMTVRVDGERKYVWPVSTGVSGYDTPSGKYRPFRMEKEHFSKEWDDAPMPYSMFFTARGHAIHGSYHVKSLGRKASHGCVRLEPKNAAILFSMVQKAGLQNTTIKLSGGLFDGGFGDSFNKFDDDVSKSAKKLKRKIDKASKKRFSLFGGDKS